MSKMLSYWCSCHRDPDEVLSRVPNWGATFPRMRKQPHANTQAIQAKVKQEGNGGDAQMGEDQPQSTDKEDQPLK